ncbi:MAG: flagellar basal body-associated FliL family protein [Alphaproteobacteria bacterium]|jgi:flagellar FliL protein|nr:flagellar basal body-associated FliL family protein [Alphaproteobacteria bacterium]
MADEENEEPKKKSGLVKILLFVFAGILLIAVGLGVGYFMFGSQQPDPSEEIDAIIEKTKDEAEAEKQAALEQAENVAEKVAKEKPEAETFVTTYFEFPGTFTTNLRSSRKFLQLGLGVSTQYDDSVMLNIETHQLALRSEILNVMSEFTEEDIQGKAGREGLAKALADGINEKMLKLEGFGGVEEVHFTSFVLQ